MSIISEKTSEITLLEGEIKKELIALALPLLLGNILQQLYNTADALIAGQFLGTDAFAAVGVAGSVMNLFIFMLNGFCVGLSVIFAQLYGAGNQAAFRREVFVAVSLGSLITLLLSISSIAALQPVLSLIHTPPGLTGQVSAYLNVIIAGMIATYFYNLFSGILRSVGNINAALYFLFLSVVLNVAFDYLFVALFSFGVAGAAWATVLAQSISASGCFCYLLKRYGLASGQSLSWQDSGSGSRQYPGNSRYCRLYGGHAHRGFCKFFWRQRLPGNVCIYLAKLRRRK